MSPGRNDSCPCGSGRKYKHCCGRSARSQQTQKYNPESALRLALEHQAAHRLNQAEALYRQVLSRQPDHPDALHNLGWLAHLAGDRERAAKLVRRALELTPASWVMHYNLGRILRDGGLFIEAAASLQRAAALNAGLGAIQVDLGVVLAALGRASEVPRCFERALAASPMDALAFSNYLHSLNYLPEWGVRELYARHLEFGQRFSRSAPRSDAVRPRQAPGRRIRLGYVSGDFRDFVVAWFIEPVIANHDRSGFEVFCYSNHKAVDDVTKRLQSRVEHWRSIAGMADDKAAEQIRRDGIDVLIDLSGHTRDNRLALFALKPAPIQVSWLGYFNTTGLPEMDYLISDPVSSPVGDAQPFTETLARMPDVRLCYQPPTYAPDVARLPALANGCVTFGTFNKLVKLTDRVIGLWARILNAVAGSRLLLKGRAFSEEATRERFRELFARHGIGAERLLLREDSPHAAMLSEYGDMDVALDPFPFSGGLTTCEALWQGVPVLTLRGDMIVSRQSASFLTAVGLHDWIAGTADDYVARAIRFAQDIEALSKVRARLRPRMAGSAVCDAPAFTRHFEGLCREMLQK